MKKPFFILLVLLCPLSVYSQDYYDYYDDYYGEYSGEYYDDEYYDEYGEQYYSDEYSDPEPPAQSAAQPPASTTAAAQPAATTTAAAATGDFVKAISLGLGPELNGLYNHLDGFHAGLFFQLDFHFIKLMSLGLKASFVHDFVNSSTINDDVRNFAGGGLFARFYFANVKIFEFFGQVEGGVTFGWLSGYVTYEKFGVVDVGFWLGGELGARINANKLFYVEPFVRGGYPFAWAAGFALGFKFEVSKKK